MAAGSKSRSSVKVTKFYGKTTDLATLMGKLLGTVALCGLKL